MLLKKENEKWFECNGNFSAIYMQLYYFFSKITLILWQKAYAQTQN